MHLDSSSSFSDGTLASSGTSSKPHTLVFVRIIGSLGESLESGEDEAAYLYDGDHDHDRSLKEEARYETELVDVKKTNSSATREAAEVAPSGRIPPAVQESPS